MERSFGLFFHLKKNKVDHPMELPVYVRITVNGSCCEISTKRHCDPAKWDVKSGRCTGKSDSIKALNAYLDELQLKVFQAKKKLLETDKVIKAESIKNIILGKESEKSKHMLLEIFQHHNDQMTALVGQEYAAGTLERYKTSYKHTEAFLKWKYKYADMDITKLDFEFITEYDFWLKSIRKCDHNTSVKYLSNFKKIINRCLRNGWLQRDPFMGFKMGKKEVQRTALTEFELQVLSTKKFEIERLSLVKDIFLFSCYSGLAYADVKKLKRSEIGIGIDGEKWIFTRRQKTDDSSRIPLLPVALKIINQYADHPQFISFSQGRLELLNTSFFDKISFNLPILVENNKLHVTCSCGMKVEKLCRHAYKALSSIVWIYSSTAYFERLRPKGLIEMATTYKKYFTIKPSDKGLDVTPKSELASVFELNEERPLQSLNSILTLPGPQILQADKKKDIALSYIVMNSYKNRLLPFLMPCIGKLNNAGTAVKGFDNFINSIQKHNADLTDEQRMLNRLCYDMWRVVEKLPGLLGDELSTEKGIKRMEEVFICGKRYCQSCDGSNSNLYITCMVKRS